MRSIKVLSNSSKCDISRGEINFSKLESEAAQNVAKTIGPLWLPHFNGSGTPEVDWNSRAALLGVRMPRRRMFSDDSTGFWTRVKNLFTQRITWTALAYCILQLGLGIAYFTVFVVLIGLSVYLLAMPITVLVLDMPAYIILGDTEYLATDWSIPIFFLLGVLLLPATMHLVKLVGKGHGAFAKFMLVSKKD